MGTPSTLIKERVQTQHENENREVERNKREGRREKRRKHVLAITTSCLFCIRSLVVSLIFFSLGLLFFLSFPCPSPSLLPCLRLSPFLIPHHVVSCFRSSCSTVLACPCNLSTNPRCLLMCLFALRSSLVFSYRLCFHLLLLVLLSLLLPSSFSLVVARWPYVLFVRLSRFSPCS